MANIQIQTLYTSICATLGGRTDLGPAASSTASYIWPVIDSIRELTETYDFEELHVPSGIVPLIQGQAVYSIQTFLASLSATTAYDITDIVDWGYFLNPGSTTIPWRTLKYRRKPTQDLYAPISAPPVYYTRFGSPIGIAPGNELQIGPTPDQTYNSIMYFAVRHPFTETLYDSPIYVPESWYEIIKYSACLRIATANNSTQFVNLFKTILFGDPKGRGEPGLIKARVAQMERDAMHNERQLTMVIQNYGYGS